MSFTLNVGCLLILCMGKICCFGVIDDFGMERRVCCVISRCGVYHVIVKRIVQ